ncbi:MAG: GTP-binding protein, partial [Glaciihabitans sp.]|nr:GTP-binding protein [Glaciihabitans sp.]
MTNDSQNTAVQADSDDVVSRVLARDGATSSGYTVFGSGRADAIQMDSHYDGDRDGDQFDREDRAALRRVGGLSTELQDVTEVEYRQLRLENVILIGIYSSGTVTDAENSLRELAAL